MDINVIDFLKDIKHFEYYFSNRNLILGLMIVGFVILSVCLAEEIKQEIKSEECKESFIKILISVLISVIVGTGLNAAGMEIVFSIDHMPILLFSAAVIITTIIQGIECFRFYKNYGEIIKRANRIYIGITECTIFLLAVMGRLETIELLTAVAECLTMEVLNIFWKNYTYTEKNSKIDKQNQTVDIPIAKKEDLFESRKQQLNQVCRELERFDTEPFAVAVSGKWGTGKTSFVNVLKENLKNAEFINVRCGIEYNAKSVLTDISTQMQKIYAQNHIYTGKNNIIEKYFEKIGEAVEISGYEQASAIINKFQIKDDESYWEHKETMNKELKMFYELTQKRIYFIVDDMDRIINEKEREFLFQILRESIGLEYSVTLFSVDYDKLISEQMSREFLEKYINFQFKLCDVTFKEIISEYGQQFFGEAFWEDKSEYIKKEGKKAAQDIIENGIEIYDNIQDKMKEIEERGKNRGNGMKLWDDKQNPRKELEEKEKEDRKKYLDVLKKAGHRLQSRMKNPRKVKRYLSDIRTKLEVLDDVWFQNVECEKNEYSNGPWVKTIFEVAFLKTFLDEEYVKLSKVEGVEYLEKDSQDEYIIKMVISAVRDNITENETGRKIVNNIIYELYALNPNINKSERQKLLEEIDKSKIQEENILLYTEVGLDFERINQVVDYMANHSFKNRKHKCEAIIKIISILERRYSIDFEKSCEISKKIKKVIDDSMSTGYFGLEEKEKIEKCIQHFEGQLIYGRTSMIRTLLELLYHTDLQKNFQNMDSIDRLYAEILGINQLYPLPGFVKEDTKLKTLICYFSEVKKSFGNSKFQYAEKEIMYFLNPIIEMLEILKIWFQPQEENAVKENFRYYDSVNIEMRSKILKSSENLDQWLKNLEEYIAKNPENIEAGNAFIELVMEVEDNFKENNVDYIGIRKDELVKKLRAAYDFLQEKFPMEDEFGDRWKFCKIRLLRLEFADEQKKE